MSAEADLDHPANQVSVNKRAFSNDELLEQLSKRALTNDELLEQLNQLRRELHKRGRSEAEVPPAPASSSSDDGDDEGDVWDPARMKAVKEQILEKHQRSRTSHNSAGPEDDAFDEHKYRVLEFTERTTLNRHYDLHDATVPTDVNKAPDKVTLYFATPSMQLLLWNRNRGSVKLVPLLKFGDLSRTLDSRFAST